MGGIWKIKKKGWKYGAGAGLLKKGVEQKRGEGKQIFKRGRGRLGQGVGALKRGTGTPLQTVETFSAHVFQKVVLKVKLA